MLTGHRLSLINFFFVELRVSASRGPLKNPNAVDGSPKRKTDGRKKQKLWISSKISQLMKGNPGTRVFDQAEKSYCKAILEGFLNLRPTRDEKIVGIFPGKPAKRKNAS